MGKPGQDARQAAVNAMTAVTEEGRLLSEALPEFTKDLDPGDRARAGRLATEALRWASRSDRVLGPHLRMKPEDPVLNALRLALFEIFEDKAPPHAAVDAAVSNVKRSKSGLVNGVLRNVLRREVVWSDLPLPQVSKWLRKRLIKAWGKDVVAELEAVHAKSPPLDLTMKNAPVAELAGTVLPTGSVRLAEFGQVSRLPGYDSGDWWVQDAGATVAVKVLDPKPGMAVLDLCAAPGGKAMQLAAAGADVTALDISDDRLGRLRENLERTKLKAKVIAANLLKWDEKTQFDAVLLDAPCSATGTLRRHPDLAYARDGSGIDNLLGLQSRMLDRALDWVKPEGHLVFCTCSLLPEEGEAQVEAALERHPDWVVDVPLADWMDPAWVTDLGLRLRPDHWAETGGIDGFFVTRLKKRA